MFCRPLLRASCFMCACFMMHLGCRCGCRPIQGRTARCHNRAFVRPVPVGPRLHWPGVSLGRFAGSRRKCNIPIHCQKVKKCICAHGHALASKERPHVPRWRCARCGRGGADMHVRSEALAPACPPSSGVGHPSRIRHRLQLPGWAPGHRAATRPSSVQRLSKAHGSPGGACCRCCAA